MTTQTIATRSAIVKSKNGEGWGVFVYKTKEFYPLNHTALDSSEEEYDEIAPELILHEKDASEAYLFSILSVINFQVEDGKVTSMEL
jgi:hypothetical protein